MDLIISRTVTMDSLPIAQLKDPFQTQLLQPPLIVSWSSDVKEEKKKKVGPGFSCSDSIVVETKEASGSDAPFLCYLLVLADSIDSSVARSARNVLWLALLWHRKEWHGQQSPPIEQFGYSMLYRPDTNDSVVETLLVDAPILAQVTKLQKFLVHIFGATGTATALSRM
jgi:hypothetical protein